MIIMSRPFPTFIEFLSMNKRRKLVSEWEASLERDREVKPKSEYSQLFYVQKKSCDMEQQKVQWAITALKLESCDNDW